MKTALYGSVLIHLYRLQTVSSNIDAKPESLQHPDRNLLIHGVVIGNQHAAVGAPKLRF